VSARFCGQCGKNVLQVGQREMHPDLDAAHVLCGVTGKRTLTYTTFIDATAALVEDPLVVAKRELEKVAAALTYHEAHEDTPCEVSTESGWVDIVDLLKPLVDAINRA
jgi:hypothetical protein